MTNTGGSTTPAGWYTDPGGSGHLRWWDGTTWTAHLAPQPTPAPAPAPAPSPTPTPVVPLPPVAQQAPTVYEPAMTADNQPYVPFQGSWNTASEATGYSVGSGDNFARPTQWNTVGAWLLAFSGLLSSIAVLVVIGTSGTSITSAYSAGRFLGVGAVVFLVNVLFAEADRRKLRSLGYLSIPSLWWMLLSPLVYLIVRTVKVWGEVRKGIAPLVTYFVVNVVSGLLVSVLIVVVLPGALGVTSSAAFTSSLQTGLNHNGGHYTVTCPPTLSVTVGANFTCTAVDGSGVSHALSITIVRGADGQPTAKLLSVTPPIAG